MPIARLPDVPQFGEVDMVGPNIRDTGWPSLFQNTKGCNMTDTTTYSDGFIRDIAESARCMSTIITRMPCDEAVSQWEKWLRNLLSQCDVLRSIKSHSKRLDDAIFAASNPRIIDRIPECEVDLRIPADSYPLTQIAELFENGFSRAIGDLVWTANYVGVIEEDGKYFLEVACYYE